MNTLFLRLSVLLTVYTLHPVLLTACLSLQMVCISDNLCIAAYISNSISISTVSQMHGKLLKQS
jgi:hypothetical protein